MDVVGAALGSDLDLGSAEAAIFGVISVGHDFYALDRIFRRGDDSCSAPDRAGGADAVNRNAIVLSLLPIGNDLCTVFGLEDAVRTTGSSPPSLGAGKVKAATGLSLRPISE